MRGLLASVMRVLVEGGAVVVVDDVVVVVVAVETDDHFSLVEGVS